MNLFINYGIKLGASLTPLAAPTITFYDRTNTTIRVFIKNNANVQATIYYQHNNSTPTAFQIILNAGQTGLATVSGLSQGTSYTIYAQATATGFDVSPVVSLQASTGIPQLQRMIITAVSYNVCNWIFENNMGCSTGQATYFPACRNGLGFVHAYPSDQCPDFWFMYDYWRGSTSTVCEFSNFGSWTNVTSCSPTFPNCTSGAQQIACRTIYI